MLLIYIKSPEIEKKSRNVKNLCNFTKVEWNIKNCFVFFSLSLHKNLFYQYQAHKWQSLINIWQGSVSTTVIWNAFGKQEELWEIMYCINENKFIVCQLVEQHCLPSEVFGTQHWKPKGTWLVWVFPVLSLNWKHFFYSKLVAS